MSRAFVDTGAWYEFIVRRARRHAAFVNWFQEFDGRLTTSSDVWTESMSLVKNKYGHGPAQALGEHLRDSDVVHLVSVEDDLREEAWELFKARPDKGYSLVDCTSFIIMQRMNIQLAAATDDHFRQEGFEVVPA